MLRRVVLRCAVSCCVPGNVFRCCMYRLSSAVLTYDVRGCVSCAVLFCVMLYHVVFCCVPLLQRSVALCCVALC